MDPARERAPRWPRRLLALSGLVLLLQAALLMAIGHGGPNYYIYRYFADLSNAGVDIFDPAAHVWEIPHAYLDFTPLNLVIYKVIAWCEQRVGLKLFILYEAFQLWLAIIVVHWLWRRQLVTARQFVCFSVLLACNPGLTILNLFYLDDKSIYVTLPLVCVAITRSRWRLGSFATGVYAGWTGGGVACAALPWLSRPHPKHAWLTTGVIALGLVIIGIALTWSPFFPDNAVMLRHRMARESLEPFWFSILQPLGSLHAPWLRPLMVVVWIAAVSWGRATRRLSVLEAFVGCAATYMMFSNHTMASRVLTTGISFVLVARTRSQMWTIVIVVWSHAQLAAVMRLARIDFVTYNRVHGFAYDTLEAIIVNLPVGVGMAMILSFLVRRAEPGR